MAKSNEYWAKRFELLKRKRLKTSTDTMKELEPIFKDVVAEMQKEIEAFYGRYAKDGSISLEEAKKELTSKEAKALRMDLKEFTKNAQIFDKLPKSEQQRILKASLRVRFTRQQALYYKLEKYINSLHVEEENVLSDVLSDMYKDSYYQTAYEVQKVHGYHQLTELNSDKVNEIIKQPWADDNKNFSERIWGNQGRLITNLQKEFTRGFLLKSSNVAIAESLQKSMNTTFNNAYRLVETEGAYISELASTKAYKDNGIEQIQIIAVLDTKTSPICREMDLKVIPIEDDVPGVTTPPFHCYCRSTKAPYNEFVDDDKDERVAVDTDTGKEVNVKGDLQYKEWYNKYVKDSETYKREQAEKAERQRIKENKAKIKSILDEHKEMGVLIYPPQKIDLTSFTYDEAHVKEERGRDISREEAISFMNNAIYSLKRWNGKYVNFYSKKGSVYLNVEEETIRTAYTADLYKDKLRLIMEDIENESFD